MRLAASARLAFYLLFTHEKLCPFLETERFTIASIAASCARRRAHYVDNSMSIVTAAINTMNATAELTSHGLERLMPKPASATMRAITEANSAISANPFNVIIASSRAALRARSARRAFGENPL